jgi:membrane-associated protein
MSYLLDPTGLLGDVIAHAGAWVYGVIFAIVFAETGLVVAPFLPGDSLLFAAGALSGAGELRVWVLVGLVLLAAIGGDAVNYAVGRFFGRWIADKGGRFVKRRHIDATQVFFARHGGKALVLARFVPIVRTFAPFVSGMGGMSLGRFWRYNVVGAIAWVALFVGAGYFFGTIPWVEQNLTLIMLGIIVASVVPLIAKGWLHRRRLRSVESKEQNEREKSWIAPYVERD